MSSFPGLAAAFPFKELNLIFRIKVGFYKKPQQLPVILKSNLQNNVTKHLLLSWFPKGKGQQNCSSQNK